MSTLEITPRLLVVSVAIALVSGVMCLFFGRKLPRRGDWLVCGGLLSILVVFLLAAGAIIGADGGGHSWFVGWVWPKSEPTAIIAGILQDTLGLIMSILVVFVAGLTLIREDFNHHQDKGQRFFAAVGIGCAGVVLTWISATPWIAIGGLAITLFGGWVGLSLQDHTAEGAALLIRFGKERTSGIVLTMLGAFALAAAGAGLGWTHGDNPTPEAFAGLGAVLFFLGLFVQLSAFPFLGGLVVSSEALFTSRLVLGQVFPAWGVCAIFLRSEGVLRSSGFFSFLGGIALALCVLSCLSGLFQTSWKSALRLWLSAALLASLVALAFSGPESGLLLLISSGLSATALAFMGAALELGGTTSTSHQRRAKTAKAGALGAAGLGGGMLGFGSAGGFIRWLEAGADDSLSLICFTLAHVLLGLLLWRTAWIVFRGKRFTQATWLTLGVGFVPLLLGMGIIWSGTLSGGALSGNPDLLFGSLIGEMSAALTSVPFNAKIHPVAQWIHCSSLVFGVVMAYWISAGRQNTWLRARKAFPRFVMFIESGYGMDFVAARGGGALFWLSGAIYELVDVKVWGSWIPQCLNWGVCRSATAVRWLDSRIVEHSAAITRSAVQLPARLLQLIQNGNVQWYLLFAVGSGIAMLLHFLRF